MLNGLLYAAFSPKFQFYVYKQSLIAFNSNLICGVAYNNVVNSVKRCGGFKSSLFLFGKIKNAPFNHENKNAPRSCILKLTWYT